MKIFVYQLHQDALEKEKRLAQIHSAKRSLVTNLACMSVFFVIFTLIFLLPLETRNYASVFIYSCVKSLMPLLSTVANFGTIQSVFLQYKEYFLQLRVVKNMCKTWWQLGVQRVLNWKKALTFSPLLAGVIKKTFYIKLDGIENLLQQLHFDAYK